MRSKRTNKGRQYNLTHPNIINGAIKPYNAIFPPRPCNKECNKSTTYNLKEVIRKAIR
jgi:hypothetical protein